MGAFFIQYIQSLNDYELLTIYNYRLKDINVENKNRLEKEIASRFLSLKNYDQLKSEAKKIKKNELQCSRCKNFKIVIEDNTSNKIEGWQLINIALTYAPWTLKDKYRCELCGFKFSRWPRFSDIIKRA